ncbi:MAG: S41 family peptidase [Phycisphaerales bacterium]|nr:S41 family peptidase [Phycisphaerales bacterium]MCB9862467.1 S41 family peptidase [Phycisphaerales bacterium]
MPKRNLAWVLIVVAVALILWQLPQQIAGRDSVLRAFGPLVDARAQIHRRYVTDINDDKLSRAAIDEGIRAMLRQLNDPYAVYLNAEEFRRFHDRTHGKYAGIGVEVWTTEYGLEVLSRETGSPADIEGILPEDLITHIDGEPIAKLSAFEAVNNRLNGAAGTTVSIRVIRGNSASAPGAILEFKLTRAEIEIDPVRGWGRDATGGWRYLLDPGNGVGYIRLVKFTDQAPQRMTDEIERMLHQGMKALILDLRENGGGLLDTAWGVADRFLDSGIIVTTKGRRSAEQQWYANMEGTLPNFPMVILVNGATASASEIVAGSLQDHKRAVVFGERTFGKGSVQELIPLASNGGAIKLTTRYYYLPSGVCIHRQPGMTADDAWGVRPTHLVKLNPAERSEWMRAWRDVAREPTNGDADVVTSSELLAMDKQLRESTQYLIEQLEKSPVSAETRTTMAP